MIDIQYLTIIWCSVFISYWFANKTKMTPVLFYLLMGSVMVTVGLLPKEATPFINGFAEFGIILIMFALGFEENPTIFVRSIKRSWGIAFFGALGPFLAAYFLALHLWQDQNVAILVGLTMTATAVSLTMVVLKYEGLNMTKTATGIMTSAVLDDIASLVLVAAIIPLVTGDSGFTLVSIATIGTKVGLFFLFVTFVGVVIFPGKESEGEGFLNKIFTRYGLHNILAFSDGRVATLAILTIALVFGVLAHHLGLHPALGSYMAGLIMRKKYFYLTKRGEKIHTYKKTRKIIDDVAYAWIGPVFFVNLGSKLYLDFDLVVSILDTTLVLTFTIFVVQIISAALAARYTGNFTFVESMMIGFGMLGRAELAFVVMDLGYAEYHIFSTEVFYTLMFTAFALNICVPLTIRFWKPYFTGEK
ncbi:MAG: Kef-type K+ transport system membrane component KefB [Enterobacterales bacterium]|jgi:Kef-type K+ transport system membrane component KefB